MIFLKQFLITVLLKKLLNKKFDFDKFWKADLPKFIKDTKTSDEIRLK